MATNPLVTYGTTTDFIGRIGVAAHSGPYTAGIYSSAQSVVGAASYAGISNVRNTFFTDAADVAFYKTLALGGIKFDFLAPSELAQQGAAGIQAFVAGLGALVHAQPNAVMSVEGANEVNLQSLSFNGDGSLAGATAFQQALFQSVRSDASFAGMPLLNVSVGYNDSAAYSQLAGTSGYFDVSNIHAYNSSQAGILVNMLGAVASAAPLGPDKPFIITESGYTTDPGFATLGVDETTQAKLTIDTLLDAFAVGAQKTFLYELFDNYQSSDGLEKDHHWGLFRADGTPKPAASALHNLTRLLSADGGGAMSGTFQVSGLSADGHSLSLAKTSGATDLMLWRDTSLWDDTTHSAKSIQPEQVTITFSAVQAHVYVYSPVDGATPIASYTNVSSITLPLSDSPLMVELGASQPATVDAAASDPTVTMDAATFVAKLGILAQTNGISHVALTGEHVLQMSSVQSMQDIVGRYGSVLSKIDGGFQFEIDNSGSNWKIASLYNQAGSLTSTTSWAYNAAGATTAMSVANADQSGEYDNYGVTGQSYTHDRYVYTAGRALQSLTRYHGDNTLDSAVTYNGDGSRTVESYDAAGNKTQEAVTAADGGVSILSYDGAGRQTVRQDVTAWGVVTNWTYEASGAAKTMSVTNPDQSGEYDNYGVTGQSYTHDRYVYAAGRALQSVTRYHGDGTLDSAVQYGATGSRIVDSYDAAGHKSQEVYTGADGGTSTFNYDSAGRTTTRQDVSATGVHATWTYDASGAAKTMSVTNPDQSGEYDNYGVTGQSYTHDRYVYTAGRALQSVTRYHGDGTLDSAVQYGATGSRIVDSYDAAGHKSQEVYTGADGGTSTFNYDSAGRTTTRQDVSATGVHATWTYDASGAAKTMSVTNPDQSGEYDNYGVTGQSYTHDRYVYGSGGALQSVARYHADNTLDNAVTYYANGSRIVDSYDAAGHKSQEVYTGADGGTSTFNYDSAGRTTTRQDVSATGVHATWTYDASGAAKTMSVTNPDQSGEYDNYGVTGQSYTHDRYVYTAGRALQSVTRYHGDGTLDSAVQYGATGSRIVDSYDAAGHKSQEVYTGADGGTSTFNYDSAGRTTTRQDVSATGVHATWTYDASGAAKTMSVTNPDQSGEYDNYGVTGQSYTHDRYVYGSGGALQSVARYHADNTLDNAVTYYANGSRIVDSYDAAGHKTQEVASGGAGADYFVMSYGANDMITGVNFSEGDKIDLSRIDAVSNNDAGTSDHFTLVPGSSLTGQAGQLVVVQDSAYLDGKHWIVEGDTVGHGHADYVLHITTTGVHIPSTSDFIF